MTDAISQLVELSKSRFTGVPIPCDDGSWFSALVYTRWVTTGVVDIVTVYDEFDATASRASGLNPMHPENTEHAQVQWRYTGTVADVVARVLALPTPGGHRVIVRAADPRRAATRAAALTALGAS